MRTYLMICYDGSEWIVQHDKGPKKAQDFLAEAKGVEIVQCKEIKNCSKPRVWRQVSGRDESWDPVPTAQEITVEQALGRLLDYVGDWLLKFAK